MLLAEHLLDAHVGGQVGMKPSIVAVRQTAPSSRLGNSFQRSQEYEVFIRHAEGLDLCGAFVSIDIPHKLCHQIRLEGQLQGDLA